MESIIHGKKVYFSRTIPQDIKIIRRIEKDNNRFVHEYSREKHLELLKDPNCFHITIRRNDNDEIVGHILLFELNNPNKLIEFRRIAIKEKGKGYGREALRLLKKLCFEELGCHRLWLDVYTDNQIAIKLYESEGFVYEGTLRENYKTKDGYRSQSLYSMLEHEYKSRS